MTEQASAALPDELRVFLSDQARQLAHAGLSPEEILGILRPIADEFFERVYRPMLAAARDTFAKADAAMTELGISAEHRKYYRSLLRQQMDLDPYIARLLDEEILWPNRTRLRVVK